MVRYDQAWSLLLICGGAIALTTMGARSLAFSVPLANSSSHEAMLAMNGLGGMSMAQIPASRGPNDPASSDRRTPDTTEVEAFLNYRDVIERTKGMVSNPQAQTIADQFELDILNVTWEDTGRYYNSAVGPNISDMTIQVQQQDPRTGESQLHLMPVIRFPNFEDVTADVPLDRFFVLVGNERGEDLQRVSLRELLGNLRNYLHEPTSWAGRERSLLRNRDTHVLVSAQACFLPIPQAGRAEFNPVLFNYQSYPGDPAVLTILATREGTSVTVIDNQRDAFEAGQTWGQRLFFNQNGERASLTGQRLSDFEREAATDPTSEGPTTATADGAEGLNMVLLIQVPLKQQRPLYSGDMDMLMEAAPAPASAPMAGQRSNVENAVIGHGAVEGPFTEIAGLPIERDPDFPIRVTVQFYKATSNGEVSEADLAAIHQQITRIYDDADYVGSLVVEGPSGRPTEHDGPKEEPADWWERFWQRYEQDMGRSRQSVFQLWQRLLGSTQ